MSRVAAERLGYDSLWTYETSAASGRCMRMRELAQHVNGSVTRLSNAAKRLEECGWMRRPPAADNGRYLEATLTDAGMAVVEQAGPGHIEAVRRYAFDALSTDQVTALRDIGRQIAGRLDGGLAGMPPGRVLR